MWRFLIVLLVYMIGLCCKIQFSGNTCGFSTVASYPLLNLCCLSLRKVIYKIACRLQATIMDHVVHQLDATKLCNLFNVSLDRGLDDARVRTLLDQHGSNSYESWRNKWKVISNALYKNFSINAALYLCLDLQLTLCFVFGLTFSDGYLTTFAIVHVCLLLFITRFIITLRRAHCLAANANKLTVEARLTHCNDTPQVNVIRQQPKINELVVCGYLKKCKINQCVSRVYEQNIIRLIGKYCAVAYPIDVNNLVPGDVVIVSNGDAIRADMRIVECSDDFMTDRLTADSLLQHKNTTKYSINEFPLTAANLLYDGRFCVKGWGKAIVVSTTGANTVTSRKRCIPYLKDNFVTRRIAKIEKIGVVCFSAVIIVLIINIYFQIKLLGKVVFICGWILIVICLGLIFMMWFCVIRLLTNQLNDKGLFCKTFETQVNLSNVNVIMTDIEGIIVENFKQTYDGDIDDHDHDFEMNEKQMNELKKIIKLCDSLGITLIFTTRLNQHTSDIIWQKSFGSAFRSDMRDTENDKSTRFHNQRYYNHKISTDVLQSVEHGKHTLFANMNAQKRFSLIMGLTLRQNPDEILFILNGADDASSLRKLGIGVALSANLATECEKYASDAVCTADNPLQTIIQSIGISRQHKASKVSKVTNFIKI